MAIVYPMKGRTPCATCPLHQFDFNNSNLQHNLQTGPNPEIDQWAPDIQKAAKITGLDPNLIGGMIWAESRGDPNTKSTNPGDGNADLSLMQISQERWKNELLPNLTADERANIKELTGKDADQLNMNDPHDNIIGGSIEIQRKIQEKGSIEASLDYYVGGPSVNPNYVENVMQYRDELANGKRLSQDPHG